MFNRAKTWISEALITYLTSEIPGFEPAATSDPDKLRSALKPSDVLLVEGNARISTAIKYMTQSTWSHSALYVGDVLNRREPSGEPHVLVEVTLEEGCASAPLSKYSAGHTRICRPVGLSAMEAQAVCRYMIDHIGIGYDMRNFLDLARYLMPTPPIPVRFRRRLIALGSGDPTRAICSTLMAQAFEQVRYPILPKITRIANAAGQVPTRGQRREIFQIRHHSLYAPRDFDLSPYFAIVKPTIEAGFSHRKLMWSDSGTEKA